MCKFKLFSIAAAALMMVACSNEDLTQQTQTKAGKMQFSATIAAPSSGATTRTIYTEDTQNKKITVAWKVDDEIALVHNGVKDVATVKTINSDGSATITGYVTGATNNADVRLVYPAARVGTVTGGADGTEYTADETVEGKLKTQDGTLAYIQDNLDFREDMGQLAVSETGVTLAEKAGDISPLLAIWKLTLSDGTNNLSATQVKIKGGENVLASTTTLTAGTSDVTLAIPTDVYIDGALTIEATVGDDTYAYTKAEGATFNPGTYYQSTVTMAPAATDLSKLTADYTVKNGETLTGTLNGSTQKYKISIAAGATVTLDNATINGVSGGSATMFAGINCEGDATIILKDGTTNTVKGFSYGYPGIYVPENKTLTIKGETAGTGKLTASSSQGGTGAGIGGGFMIDCGNIEIQGGDITAYGGDDAAGIGSANNSSCGSITISGGTVNATSDNDGAGIGSGNTGTCTTITISGGTVVAKSGDRGAGIGSGFQGTCGNISISGGTVSATGGESGAAIGSGSYGSCGDILISGGTVSATGGAYAAAIGSGDEGSCGSIEITTDVTQVTATKVSGFETVGRGGNGSCTSVSIGGTVYWNGSAYQNGGGTYLLKSTILYPVPDPIELSAVTSSQLGWIVGNDGKAYAVGALPESVGAVAMICYVGSSTGVEGYTHGLALALTDVSANTLSWDNTGANNAGKTAAEWCSDWNTTKTITVGTWMLPSYDQWDKMITAAGGYEALRDGFSGIAGASNLQSGGYWSSTENGSNRAYYYDFGRASRVAGTKSSDFISVRACLAF